MLAPQTINSIGAYPRPITVNQPDGTEITIKNNGDEWHHWVTTTDGYRVMKNDVGVYEYTSMLKSGTIVPSGTKANNTDKRSDSEKAFVLGLSKSLSQSELQKANIKRSKVVQLFTQRKTASKSVSGSFKLLVILANFSDTQTTYTQEDFNNLLNQQNYNGTGSFREYYLENSKGAFDVVSTVTAWVSLPKTHDYYGPESKWGEFAYQAIKAAYNSGIDMSQFDNDGDGVIDGVAICHQGNGQESTDDESDIWSHASSLSSAGYSASALTFGTVKADYYFTQPELNVNGSAFTTIGVFCHEFGHVIGALDYYDTDYKENGQYDGTGSWDLMGIGAFNGSPSGSTPAHHNPYTKIGYGWFTPEVLSTVQSVVLPPVMTSGKILKVNTAANNEYFLLENRVQSGFDSYLPGAGMLIYHVDGDYITEHSGLNDVNAYEHQGLYIKKALDSGKLDTESTPFPGISENTEFTDISTPSALSWSGEKTNRSITNISFKDDTIRFDYMDLQDGVPLALSGSLINDSTVDLSWQRSDKDFPVLLAFSTDNVFGTPENGTIYNVGDTITGGGVVLYYGKDIAALLHKNDHPREVYAYRMWSNKEVHYSQGVSAIVYGKSNIHFDVKDVNANVLKGAKIEVNGFTGTSDADGKASFRGIFPPGQPFVYHVSYPGYSHNWGAFLAESDKTISPSMIAIDSTSVQYVNTNVVQKEISLTWNPVIADDFSGYPAYSLTMPNWTMVDNDELSTYGSESFDFPNEGYTGAFIVFDGFADALIQNRRVIPSYVDRQVLACFSGVPEDDGNQKNDDWLISPQIKVTDSLWLSFMGLSASDEYGLERIRVMVSQKGIDTTSDFVKISSGTYSNVPTDWTFYKFNLSSYKGKTIRFAINCVSADAYLLLLDRINVTAYEPHDPGLALKSATKELSQLKRSIVTSSSAATKSTSSSIIIRQSYVSNSGVMTYTIFRDGSEIESVSANNGLSFVDEVDNCGKFIYQIKAAKADVDDNTYLASSVENRVINCLSSASVYLNYSSGIAEVQLSDGNSGCSFEVYNMIGAKTVQGNSEHYKFSFDISGLHRGIYLLNLHYNTGSSEAVKILIK
jgi:M6 family metalloprotease-like protein